MAYLVLARKYRPTTFSELVGQEHIVRTLGNAIALGRVHHAFVFTGARGVGKTTTARLLARALNCEQGPTVTPCGSCTACREILLGNSPDVLEIDGASNTGVDNVRELRETVRYLPSRSRHKIYIIDEVHMLSQAAFNALLKTLEEPPPHVKFIFATTEPHKIPVTILSRCQRFDFRRVGMAQLTEHLRTILGHEKVAMGMPAITAVAREAQGSVRDALSLLDQVLSYAGTQPADDQVLEALGVVDRQTLFELVDALLDRQAPKLLKIIDAVDERGHDLTDVATLLLEHLRDLAVVKLSDPDPSVLKGVLPLRSPDEITALLAQAAKRSHTDLQRLFALAVTTAEDMGRSSMPKVSLEMGLLRLFDVAPVADLRDMLARLDALAQGQPMAGSTPGGGNSPSGGAAAHRSAAPTQAAKQPGPGRTAAPTGMVPAANAMAPAQPSAPVQAAPAPMVQAAGEALADVHIGWKTFVDKVRTMRPALASVLEHGRLQSFSPKEVRVAYPLGTFYWDAAYDKDNREMFTQILGEQFGQPVTFNVVPQDEDTGATVSLAEMSAERQRSQVNEITVQAMEHSAVRNAVSILGGEVKEIRPLQTDG